MIKILVKSWRRVVAVILTVVVLATPAFAGVAAANAPVWNLGAAPIKYVTIR